MLKYILKRLFISIFILFGVSVIIYTMVRLMPSDYVDNKYASQLQNGSIDQSVIDNFKKLYGIDMPDAYLTLEIGSGEFAGKYISNVKAKDYDEYCERLAAIREYGSAETGDNLSTLSEDVTAWVTKNGTAATAKARRFEKGDVIITLEKGIATVSRVTSEDSTSDNKIVINEKFEELATGTYSDIAFDGGDISLSLSVGEAKASKISYRVANGWDKFVSILRGYFTWIGKLLKGDLGNSFKYEKPVATVIFDNMWISFAIAAIATVLQFLISIPLGISSATHQYSARDYLVTIFTMIGISLPTYFFAAIAVKFFAMDLGWFPTGGQVSSTATYAEDFIGSMQSFFDTVWHLILPIFVSVVLSIGGLMRYTRTNTLEVLGADYIRTARAKGLSERTVIYKHAFRNTLIPLATLLAGILPSLFGGMMITEQFFSIDGIGKLAYAALKEGDIPFIMGYNMFLAVLTVIGTLLSDVMYSIVDPRVKLGK